MKTNLTYNKNLSRGDIKTHHYIISFDPRDAYENGLTLDRAQELSVAFCKKHFPGHQAIIATHPDGHNKSGNIHVHIVINSLRIERVPMMPYMDKACDTLPGMKHRKGKGEGYILWGKTFNLKTMAKTLLYLQENGLTDLNELDAALADAHEKVNDPYDLCSYYEPTESVPKEFIDPGDREPTLADMAFYLTDENGEEYYCCGNTKIKITEHFAEEGKPWASFWKIRSSEKRRKATNDCALSR